MTRLPKISRFSTKVKATLLVALIVGAAIPTLVVSDTLKLVLPGAPEPRPDPNCTSLEDLQPNRLFDGKNLTTPKFCVGQVDAILAPVIEDASNALRNLNQTLVAQVREVERQYNLRHLHAPGNVFTDDFDGRRVGGFGAWTPLTPDGANPWALTATKGNHSYGVANGRTGYPTGLDTYLVSPEVDLTTVLGKEDLFTKPREILERELALIPDTLALDDGNLGPVVNLTPGGPQARSIAQNQLEGLRQTGVDVNAVAKAYADIVKAFKQEARARITRAEHLQFAILEMKVRYNLANNTDGWRLEAFFEEPTAETIDTLPRLVLTPNGDPTDTPRSNLTMSPEVKVFARGPAFSGATRNWDNVTFDLSNLIGKRVWLALHLKTDFLLRANEQYFRERDRFARTDFYGLHLDGLKLNATGYPMNAQAKGFEKPNLKVDGEVTIPSTGIAPVVVIARNAGLHTEDLYVTVVAEREDGSAAWKPSTVPLKKVPPGGVAKAYFNWSHGVAPRVEGARYTLVATVALNGDPDPENPLVVHAETDATTLKDNVVRLPIRALSLARLGALPDPEANSRVTVTPPYAEENVARTVALTVKNTGTATSRVLVTPMVSQSPCATAGSCRFDNFIEGYTDGKAPTRNKTLAPGESAVLTWTLRPYSRGTYDLDFVFQEMNSAGVPTATIGGASGRLYVRDTPGPLCLDDLGDARECGLGIETAKAPEPLTATYMAPDGTGFAVGANGGLYRFAPGAVTPTETARLSTTPWRALHGTSSTDVWAVGDLGAVARYDGTRWFNQTSPGTGDLTDVAVTTSAVHALMGTTVYSRAKTSTAWVPYTRIVADIVALDAETVRGQEFLALATAGGALYLAAASGGDVFGSTAPTPLRGLDLVPDGTIHTLSGTRDLRRYAFNGTGLGLAGNTTAPEPLNAIAALSNRTLLGVGDGNRVWRFGGANLVLGAANAAGEGSFEGLLDGVRVSRTARDAVKDGLPTMGRASASFPPTHLGENVTSAATVALYRFHTAQNVTRDETGRHPLTLVGGASHEAADTSPATGSKGALRIPEGGAAYTLDDTRFDLGTTGTLEAYVRPRNPFAGGVIINREIPSAEASGVSYRLHVNGEGMPELLLGDGLDLTRVTSSVPLKANEWAHVAATWDGFWARLYVNGKLTGATPQAAYAYDNPYLDARNLTLSRRPVVIPWLGVEAPGAFPLTAVSLGRDGAFLAVGGGQVVRGASFVDQERGDWVRDAGLKGLGNPALWVGRGVTSTDGAVLYADSRDAARYVANLQDGSLTTLSTTDKTNAQNLYTNVVLRIRHAPTGPVSLYLTRLPAVELPSRVHNATPTAEDAAVDLVAVPGGTAPVERFLIASWNGTGQGTEWRTDTILLDHILAKANLSASWFLLNGLLLEVGPGATWAVDELEVKGDFTSSLGKPRRDTLLFTAGATSGNVGRWSPAVGGGQSVSQAGAGIGPYWVSTTSTGRMTTGSLWRVSENLYKGDGAWVYNDRVTGEYGNVEDARLVTPPVSLNEVIHPTLTFLTKYRFRLDESRRYDADPSPAVTTNIPITDLLGLGMVEIQVQNDDGSWGPFLPIVPQGGYPRAPTGTYIDPGARLQPTMGFWGSSNSSWPDLLKRPEVENPRSKFNESILGESTWVPVSFNLTNQDLPVNPMGRTVRFSFHTLAIPGSSGADPHVRSEGWYITDVRVKGSERAAIDLALVNATLSTPYNAALLGVGPGTTVPVKVNVTNRGLFPVSGYNVTLEAREVLNRATGLLGPVVSRDESPRLQEALLPGGTATVEIPWRVPAKARADYVVTLRVLPGTEIDGDLTNDAVALGTARVPISAKVSPDAAVNILVTPKAATRGIERRIDVTVSNTGNVPLTNFTLERTIERVTASGRADLLSTEDLGWKLETRSEKGLLPGATEDARRFRIVARDHNATDFAEDFRDRELRWTPPENARFVFTATVRLESGDRNATNNVAKDFIDSFSVFHEDALDTLLTAEEGGYSLDAGWRLSEAAAKGEGKGFVFGDPSTGRVPADADASLLLPVVDVSSAASAILTFSTNVSFESRYDGGIVETRSYRNGAWGPWHRISPEPFPGARHVVDTLHDGNPIARASTDPAAVRGLTNDSRGSFAEETGETDGWFTVSYNLGKAPGMTERATFVSHPLDTLLNDALPLIADPQKIQRPDESNLSRAVFRGKSWGEGVESWEYHDLTYNEPWPKVGPSFLWSGSGDLTDDGLRPAATAPGAGTGGAVHRLAYTVDLRTLPADHDAALRFWLWHPQGVEIACTIEKTLPFCLRVYNATAYAADANNYASFDPTKATILAQDGAWTLYEMPFSLLATNAGPLAFAGKEMTLRFEFGAQRPYRGVVVDGITVTTFRVSGLDRVDVKEIASESVGLPTPSLTFARRDQPQAAGTELTMAKGLTWAEVRPEPGAGEGLLYTPAVPNNPTPWIIATAPGGVPGEEDRYFTTSNPAVNNGKYAVNADTRLVTPLIDLTRVLGDNVTLRFSEKHAFAPALSMGDVLFPAHYGVVEASVLNEASGEWGPWHTRCAKGPQKATESCRFLGGDFNDASWASHEYNVSDLKGQKVRFAFRVVGGPLGPLQGFAIDDLQVEGDVLTGAPLQIRLRAGTDGSGHRGAWRVDDLQVVGTTYKNNLEVSLATPPTVKVTPGGTFYVNGTVRNLGENTRDSLVLRLTAAPPSAAGEEAPLPTLQLAEMRPGAPVRPGATGTLTVGPFNLLRNANASFSVLVTAPARPFADDQDKTEYVVSVGARRFTDSATYPRLVEDEVTTNLDRTVLATSRAYREVVFKSVTASPSNATPGEPITLRALLENRGTLPVNATVQCGASRILGYDPGDYSTESLLAPTQVREVATPCTRTDGTGNVTLGPGEIRTVTWTLVAPKAGGVYNVSFTGGYARNAFTPATIPKQNFLVTVDDTFEVLGATFDVPETLAGWRSAGQWSHTTEVSYRSGGGLLAGVSPRAYQAGASYATSSSSELVTPLVDLRNLSTVPTYLTFWHQPRFATGDGGVVEARILLNEAFPEQESAYSPWCRLQPEGGYPGQILSFVGSVGPGTDDPRDNDMNDAYPILPNPGLGMGPRATPAFSGFTDAWSLAVIPLQGQKDPRAGDNFTIWQGSATKDYCSKKMGTFTGHLVQFRLVAGTGAADNPESPNPDPIPRGRGQGWHVDELMVSPYHGTVGPLSQEWRIPDDSRKVYRVTLTNDAPYTETFRVSVAGSNAPASWTLTVLTPTVVVPPGGSAEAAVEVTAPREPSQIRASPRAVRLHVQGLEDPNRVATPEIELDFQPRPWPDLQVRFTSAPAAAQERVPVDRIQVEVRNIGRSANTPVTVRLLDETTGEVVGERQLRSLPADRTRAETLTFSWTPKANTIGPHVLRAEIDPSGSLEEYRRDNNVATHVVNVGRLERPDLILTAADVVVEGPGGSALDLREGDIVRVKVTVRNIGVVGAKEAVARLSIGPLVLPSKNLGFIPPGGNATALFTWLARSGEWTVVARAAVSENELNEDNNVVGTPIVVKSFGVGITVEPDALTLAPGEKALLTYTLVNEGNADERVRLDAVLPEGVRLDAPASEMLLSVGQTTRRTVTLEVLPTALAGETEAALAVRAAAGRGDRSLAPLTLTVTPVHKVAATVDSVSGTPGTILLPVTLENQGNSAEPVTLDVTVPEGWTVDATALKASVAPGARRIVHVPVTAPADTPPTSYPVAVTATLGDATATSTGKILVDEVLGVRVRAGAPSYDEAAGQYVLPAVVENVGNAPTEAKLLAVELPEGWTLAGGRDRATLDPGTEAHLRLAVKPPTQAAPGVYGLTLYADVPGIQPLSPEGQNARSRVEVVLLKPDLTLVDLDTSPKFNLVEGDLVTVTALVKNLGLPTTRKVPVQLFVDDKFVAATELALGAGENATVELLWPATPGSHTLTVAVDPERDFAETDEENNAVSTLVSIEGAGTAGGIAGAVGVPGPSLLGLVVALGVAVLLLRRR